MTPLEIVRERVLARCAQMTPVRMARAQAAGLILAQDVVATEQVPPFPNSAVDGYAVRAADMTTVPVTLRVIGELAAGQAPTIAVEQGTAIRILTGAPIPEGCDAIVMVEDSQRVGDSEVVLTRSVSVGESVRAAGSDIQIGTCVFVSGTQISAMVEGVLAAMNVLQVLVYPRARVGVLSTGDELVDDGSVLVMGQIRESNRTILCRLVNECGAEAIDLGIIRDDEALLEVVLREAVTRCDALISSGGVSMGDYDIVKAVLSRIADMEWFQISMKPAKPFAFGTLRNSAQVDVPIFGLPGNPVSSLISFELLARVALRTMMGFQSSAARAQVLAIVDEKVSRHADGKVHFDRVFATWGSDGRVHVKRTGPQGSHQLAATAIANALMLVPDGDGLEQGDPVFVTFLGPDSGPSSHFVTSA